MFCGVVRSNEKSWVCNIFVALYPKNPVKLRIQSYASDNFSYQRDSLKANAIKKLQRIYSLGAFCCIYLKLEMTDSERSEEEVHVLDSQIIRIS